MPLPTFKTGDALLIKRKRTKAARSTPWLDFLVSAQQASKQCPSHNMLLGSTFAPLQQPSQLLCLRASSRSLLPVTLRRSILFCAKHVIRRRWYEEPFRWGRRKKGGCRRRKKRILCRFFNFSPSAVRTTSIVSFPSLTNDTTLSLLFGNATYPSFLLAVVTAPSFLIQF